MGSVSGPRRRMLFLSGTGEVRGGGQVSLLLLIRHLDRGRFEPVIAVPGPGGLWERAAAEGAEVRTLALPPLRGLSGIGRLVAGARRLSRLLREARIDLVVALEPREGLYAWAASRLSGIPWIWNVRTPEEQGILGRFLARRAARVVVVAEALRARFAALSGSPRLSAIPNGADRRDFEPAVSRAEARAALGLPAAGTWAVVVGRVERAKGQDLVVEALGAGPGAGVAFAGREDPAFGEELRRRAAAGGIGERIRFLGEVSDLPRKLVAFDLLIQSSRFEAFPRAVLEGMAAGLPVIATDVGGTREALGDKAGILVPPGDAAALRGALARWTAEPDGASRTGEAGRRRAWERFEARRVAERFGRLFAEVLGDPDPGARSCPLCGAGDARAIESDPPSWTVRCAGCGLAYVDPVPADEEIRAHYDDPAYYEAWTTVQAGAREGLWRTRLGWLRAAGVSGSLLDVGCGEGAFLEAAGRAGFACTGTEVSAAAVRIAKGRGLDVREGTLESSAFPDASFDAVTMWHVLEHLPDPFATLREVRRILKPGGRLLLAVPNLEDRWFARIYRLARGRPERRFARSEREWHLFHFTGAALRRALEAAGLEGIRIDIDAPDADARKRAIEWPARAWFRLTGRNRTLAIRAVARRPA